jgi:hypothetical protein
MHWQIALNLAFSGQQNIAWLALRGIEEGLPYRLFRNWLGIVE